MNRFLKIAGIVLIVLMAGNTSLSAQRGMRGEMDSTRMERMKMGRGNGNAMRGGMEHMNMNGMGMRTMRDSRAMGPMRQMRPNGQMGQMGQMGPMRQMRPESMISESLPNVTGKQKKDIADLRLKQQEEMKKLREETAAKMQTLRDSHKEAVLKLLTEEQKKYIESKQVKPVVTPRLPVF
jgi:hypothetical protein